MAGLSYNKVVVPFDFSDEAKAAVDVAIEASGSAANVTVVHVLQELNVADPGVVWQAIDNESRTKHGLEALGEALSGDKYQGVERRVEIGDPGYRVTHFAEDSGADLIVMPSHGRQGISRMLLGSVAERVLRLAHCHVLVLRR